MNPRTLALACLLACAAAAHPATADNLVPNRDFDDHVLGWTPPNPLSAKMAFAPLDEHGSGGSGSLRLYDLAADPEEKSPIARGERFDEMARRYRALVRGVKEIAPYACGAGCLNRAYAKGGGK